MTAYYNEKDKKTAAWLRELIAEGLIARGVVDDRSIADVRPDDLAGYAQCHFFAGIGGWSLALRFAGIPDDYPIWTGSCPCQPFSQAGAQRGTADERHLWPEFYRLIRQCKPTTVVGEQVASKLGREWLAGVRADLEALGYAVGAADLCAASCGAPHIRQRLYWVADSRHKCEGRPATSSEAQGRGAFGELAGCGDVSGLADANFYAGRQGSEKRSGRDTRGNAEPWPGFGSGCGTGGLADPDGGHSGAEREQRSGEQRLKPENGGSSGLGDGFWDASKWLDCADGKSRRVPLEPALQPLANGVQRGPVGILRGAGNAIVPQLAARFIQGAIMRDAA